MQVSDGRFPTFMTSFHSIILHEFKHASPEHLSGQQKKIATDTQYHLDCYAKDGLRTLCITKKVHNPTPLRKQNIPFI